MLDVRPDEAEVKKKKEYERLKYILLSIEYYRDGKVDMAGLIGALEGLCSNMNEEYEKDYVNQVANLEVEYVCFLCDQKTDYSDEDLIGVNSLLSTIEQWATEDIQQYEQYVEEWEIQEFIDRGIDTYVMSDAKRIFMKEKKE